MSADEALDPEIENQLEACRLAVHEAQHRYGLLIGTYRRVTLLQQRFPEKKVYNSIALQPFYDSFDMLVIDLCSAAKAWVERDGGIFERLARNPASLRRRSACDFGGGHKGMTIAKGVNRIIERLFPGGDPGADEILAWGKTFDEATKKVRDDRNKVRAHRYEKVRVSAPLSSYAIPLHEYEKHVAYLVAHVRDAALMIKAIDFETKITIPDTESADLADLIFHGSVDGAFWAYGMICRAASTALPSRYDELRSTALALLEGDGALYARAFGGTIVE